jgi:ABC-2 type transport system permease protein
MSMSLRITLATTRRVLTQLRHDRRTVGLMLTIPSLLLIILRFVFDSQPQSFDRVGVILLGIFPFSSMFIVTSVAMLRERTAGSLERLLTTPLNRLDLLFGYGFAFAIAATIQASVTCLVAYLVLGLDTQGSALMVLAIGVSVAIMGMAVGLFTSAFATSEFQAVQFMPVVVMPQTLLCGLITPRERMVGWLQSISDVLPLTYAVQALIHVGSRTDVNMIVVRDIVIVLAVAVFALALGAATMSRKSS